MAERIVSPPTGPRMCFQLFPGLTAGLNNFPLGLETSDMSSFRGSHVADISSLRAHMVFSTFQALRPGLNNFAPSGLSTSDMSFLPELACVYISSLRLACVFNFPRPHGLGSIISAPSGLGLVTFLPSGLRSSDISSRGLGL